MHVNTRSCTYTCMHAYITGRHGGKKVHVARAMPSSTSNRFRCERKKHPSGGGSTRSSVQVVRKWVFFSHRSTVPDTKSAGVGWVFFSLAPDSRYPIVSSPKVGGPHVRSTKSTHPKLDLPPPSPPSPPRFAARSAELGQIFGV